MGPGMPLMRAQKDLLRAASFSVLGCGAGALRLLPVAALYLARPLAVRPAPLDTGSFSPLDTDRLTCFLAIGFFRGRRNELTVDVTPADTCAGVAYGFNIVSSRWSPRSNSIPHNRVLNDVCFRVNDCVFHLLEIGCNYSNTIRSSSSSLSGSGCICTCATPSSTCCRESACTSSTTIAASC